MDFHKGEARAENFYPRKGRNPKKFAGSPSKTVLYRQKQNKLVDKYILAMLDTHNLIPTKDELLRDVDERVLGQAIERMVGPDRIEKVERVQQMHPLKKEPLIDYVRRRRILDETDIPMSTLAKIQAGEVTIEFVADVICRPHDEIRDLMAAYNKEYPL